MDEPMHLVFEDERMEREYLVFYDDTGDPMFVVYDEDGYPMFKFGRLNRAERKALETSLRAELAALKRRIEELERETDVLASADEALTDVVDDLPQPPAPLRAGTHGGTHDSRSCGT